jgi:hypothetical protein
MILGLTDDEFFRLTPRQFHILLNRHKEVIEHQELLAGIVACVTANFSMGRPDPPREPQDYMPSQWAQKNTKKKRKPKDVVELDILTEKSKSLMLALRAKGKVIDAVTGEKIDFKPGGQPAPGGKKLV